MSEDIRFISAGTLTLEGLAELFTRSFEQYFYPGAVTAADLARRVRVEQIDLWRSPVLVVDGEPAGLALLGLRGDVAADVNEVAGFVSPNPGGVGPLTRAFLITNVVERAERVLAGV